MSPAVSNKKRPWHKALDDIDSGEVGEEEKTEEFFAITEHSVYQVSSEKDSEGTPIVQEIAQTIRNGGPVPVGERLYGGDLVGIRWPGIVLYIEDRCPISGDRNKPQRPEEVDAVCWGDRTSPIAALCLKKEEALMCLHSKELKGCDQRWRKETEKTLEKIGDNHPIFILSITEAIKYDSA